MDTAEPAIVTSYSLLSHPSPCSCWLLIPETVGKSRHAPPLGCFIVPNQTLPEVVIIERSLRVAVHTSQNSRLIAGRYSAGDWITAAATNDILHQTITAHLVASFLLTAYQIRSVFAVQKSTQSQ